MFKIRKVSISLETQLTGEHEDWLASVFLKSKHSWQGLFCMCFYKLRAGNILLKEHVW